MKKIVREQTVIPTIILIDPALTPFEKNFISISYYFRFKCEPDLNVFKYAECFKLKTQTVRRLIRYASKNPAVEKYIKIFFVKKYLGQPDQIILHFQDLEYEMKPISKMTGREKLFYDQVTGALKNSKYFSKYDHKILLENFADIPAEEFLKGLYYVDSKRNVINPTAYLRSCFYADKFKHTK